MERFKHALGEYPELLKEWDYSTNEKIGLNPETIGSQSNKEAYWICTFGHRWKAKINNRFNGRGCPLCRKVSKTSFPEQAVYFYVKKLFPDAINSYREIFDNTMELDIYIPSIRNAIEYDGIKYHIDEKLSFEEKKYKICKENHITLIRIKENNMHYKVGERLCDFMLLVDEPPKGRGYTYSSLDKVIRKLLYVFHDFDVSNLYRVKHISEIIDENVYGPKVRTDVNTKRDQIQICQNYYQVYKDNSFGALYPEQAKKWHPNKNGSITPYMVKPHTTKKFWWLGECGHEWQASVALLSRGSGCPYCSSVRLLKGFNDLKTLYPDIAKDWDYELNGELKPEDCTSASSRKVFWKCKKCKQSWSARISNRTINIRGCPYCSHQKPIVGVNDLPTLRPDLMEDWDYQKNTIDPHTLMPNSNINVYWKCHVCGYEYMTNVANKNKGYGCKRCAGYVVIKGKNDLATLYPNIAKEWDYAANYPVKPEDIFPKTNKIFNWICSLGHKYSASPNSRTREPHGTGCPYCSGNKVLPGFNDVATLYPEIAKDFHPTLNVVKANEVTKGYGKKITFLCPNCGGVYDSYISNKIKGYGKCPYCSKKLKALRRLS